MGGFLKGTNITLIHPLFPPKEAKDWTPENITRWITQAHGQTSTKFLEGETTHIVCSEAVWHSKPILVQAALAANEKIEQSGSARRPVKFVSPDWLRDALFGAHKPSSDGAYSWMKLAKAREAQEARMEKIVERAERELDRGMAGKGGGGAGAQQSMMAEVLQDATDPFLGEEDRAELERQAQVKRKEEMRRKVQEELDRQQVKEQAAIARKAAKKARNAVFSGKSSASSEWLVLSSRIEGLVLILCRGQMITTSTWTPPASNSTSASPKSTPSTTGTSAML